MAENQGNDLEVRIGGDISGFEAATNAAVGRLDDLEKKVVSGTAEIDKRTQALAKADARYAEQLKTRYDPVYAAQKRYIAELENIRRAEQFGALNAEQTEAAIQRALLQRTNAIQRVIGANNALAASNAMAARSGGRLGSTMQQVGFQIGDFATQVASGQGFLRPFIQQGTQLVSMFGPWGAVIGAAGAVVGALATTFLDLGDATDEATKETETYENTLKSLDEVIKSLNGTGKTRVQQLIEESNWIKQGIRAEIARTQTLIEQARVRAELAALADPETAFGVGNAELMRIQELQKLVDAAQARIDKLDERVLEAGNADYNDQQRKAQEAARKDQERADKEAEQAAKRRAEVIARGYADAAAQQDKDRLAAIKRGEEIIRQDNERAKKFEKYLTGLERENELLGMSSEERRLQTALMEAQAQKGAALTDVERQRVEQAQAVGEAYRRQQRVADELENSFERAFDRIGTAITEMAVEGKRAWQDFGNIGMAVLSEIAQELIKLAAINPLKNALFGRSAATLSDAGGFFGSIFSSIFHNGGVVGNDNVPQRAVPASVFANAPRLHNGLMPDEFPAILQKGEAVIPKGQVGKGGGGTVVQVIDQRQAGAPDAQVSRGSTSDGRELIRVLIPAMKQVFGSGAMDQTMGRNYGLARRGSR